MKAPPGMKALPGMKGPPEPGAEPSTLESRFPSTPPVSRILLAILLVVLVTVGGFGAWSALAHIAAAIPAVGRLSVETNRKEIQHLEGGIVREILVRDGQKVEVGTPLIVLDDTKAGAELGVQQNDYISLRATQVRLLAEVKGADTLSFDRDLVAMAERAGASAYLDTQRQLFEARRAAESTKLDINQRRLDELGQQVAAAEAQRTAAQRQLRLISEELAGTRQLFAEGYAPKTKVLALERTEAGLQGDMGSLDGRLAELRETMGKVNLESLQLENDFRSAVVQELKDTETQLKAVQERMGASVDTVRRTVVRAPEAGIVQDIRVHTVGGVVRPGDVIMEIVPQKDRLVAEVQVRPQDIEAVFPGQTANVYILPYKAKRLPPVVGTVVYVSPDIVAPENPTQEPYYATNIEFNPESLQAIRKETGLDISLYPGMPVRAMIILRERTVLDYLISPVYSVVEFGMREE